MRALRLINYIGIALSALIVVNMPFGYKISDLFFAFAASAVVLIGGYVFSYKEGPGSKTVYAITSVLLLFTIVNLGHYYPGLNLVKHNTTLTIEVRNVIAGWILIVMVIFLIVSVLFSSFIMSEKDTKKYESSLYE